MSYYSYYTFSVHQKEGGTVTFDEDQEVVTALREENENARLCMTEDGYPESHITWYEHEEDLKKFSKKYPDLVLQLSVEGENQGDIADKYFKNGKMQICRAKIDFDPYDASKLE